MTVDLGSLSYVLDMIRGENSNENTLSSIIAHPEGVYFKRPFYTLNI